MLCFQQFDDKCMEHLQLQVDDSERYPKLSIPSQDIHCPAAWTLPHIAGVIPLAVCINLSLSESSKARKVPICMQADYVLQGNDQWGNGKILLLPTVIVNKHQYRGRLDVPSILRALCAGFSETTEPEVSKSAAQRLFLDALHSRDTEC